MERDYKKERDFWLTHFYQPLDKGRVEGPLDYAKDCVPIPPPVNNIAIAPVPCWIWRWSIYSGYGRCGAKGAHVVSYEESRGVTVGKEQILHLCNRPYCVQPAHLSAGTAKQNAADRAAQHNAFGLANTWSDIADQHNRADEACYYADLEPFTPPLGKQDVLPRFYAPLLCPHSYVKGENRGCTNCGYSPNFNYRHACWCGKNPEKYKLWPCRCDEEYCRCHVAMSLANNDPFPTETDLKGCDRCRHYFFNAEFTEGPRPLGHDFSCPDDPIREVFGDAETAWGINEDEFRRFITAVLADTRIPKAFRDDIRATYCQPEE